MATSATQPTCPQCGKPMSRAGKSLENNDWFPFCSRRCKLADLDRWFSGDYRISQTIDELTSEQLIEIATEQTASDNDPENE
jgi:endogenous inhibitor of DNA gyrase (YacG/DUF329 family)